jgi:hypothetical protein
MAQACEPFGSGVGLISASGTDAGEEQKVSVLVQQRERLMVYLSVGSENSCVGSSLEFFFACGAQNVESRAGLKENPLSLSLRPELHFGSCADVARVNVAPGRRGWLAMVCLLLWTSAMIELVRSKCGGARMIEIRPFENVVYRCDISWLRGEQVRVDSLAKICWEAEEWRNIRASFHRSTDAPRMDNTCGLGPNDGYESLYVSSPPL